MKRFTALLLALLMLVSTVACAEKVDTAGEAEAETQADVTVETEEEVLDPLEARKLVSDDLPDTDCDGADFNILADNYCDVDFIAEEMSGDVLEDAVYTRNKTIENRFNINIITQDEQYGDINGIINKSVTAMDDAYDLASYHEIQAAQSALKGLYVNWTDVEYVNPEREWWSSSSFNDLRIAGKVYLAAGSMNIYTMKATYCMYVNKKLAEDYNLGNINEVVLNGEWTSEALTNVVKDSWDDLNGDGKQDSEDYFALTTNSTSRVNAYLYAFGEQTVSKNEEDLPYLNVNQEKFANMVDTVSYILYNSNGVYTESGWTEWTLFKEDRAFLLNNLFNCAFEYLRDMETDYGIIPYPKWDETQESYQSWSDGSASLMGVPRSNGDLSFVGLITEALNAESWKTVMPAAYDTVLKVKGTRDEESIDMIDMIMNNVVTDIGYTYGLGLEMYLMVSKNSTNFASYYAKKEKSWNRTIDKLVEAFSD